MKVVFFIVLVASVIYGVPRGRLIKRLDVKRLDGHCCGNRSTPLFATFPSFKVEDHILWLNTSLIVKEDISGSPTLVVSVERCESQENLDSCQFFRKIPFNFCHMLEKPTYSPFYINYTPPAKCPLRKGSYRSINSKIDLISLMLNPLDQQFWKIQSEVVDEDKRLLMCFTIEAYSIPERQK